MPELQTADFGTVEYLEESSFLFPRGLPGFEDQRRFVLFEKPELAPFLFLQSASTPALRFVCVPIGLAAPGYSFRLDEEDTEALALPEGKAGAECSPGSGSLGDILCLAVVTFPDSAAPTVNLLAPVLLSVSRHLGCQSIQFESGYSHCQPLNGARGPAPGDVQCW